MLRPDLADDDHGTSWFVLLAPDSNVCCALGLSLHSQLTFVQRLLDLSIRTISSFEISPLLSGCGRKRLLKRVLRGLRD